MAKEVQTLDFDLYDILGIPKPEESKQETIKEKQEQPQIPEYQYKPEDYSDIGQAEVYANVFDSCVSSFCTRGG